tara:strand:+ start:43 stop:228 length:186 start_codon:yes stop_codon:yes gene_type:complete
MFGLFNKKSPIDKLHAEYQKLMEESFRLSTIDRSASDAKRAKAEDISKRISEAQLAAKLIK